MAYNTYTTSDLVNDITLFGHLPTGQNTFTPTQLLRLSTLELQTPLVQQIMSTRGGYYLTYADYPAAQDGLYDIPSDCVAGALVNVELVQEPTIIPVNPIEESEQFSTISPTSTSYGFFPRGNQIQILPTPSIGVARFWYIKRTSDLVLTSQCAQITSIASNVFTVSSVPSTLTVDDTIDLVGDQPPFNILGTRTITNIVGTDITLSSAVNDSAIGNWICLESQTCVPQIPVEYRILLTQRVICKIYELQGYLDKKREAEKALEKYEKATIRLITPRASSKTKVISPVNGGFLSGTLNRMTNFPAGHTV